MVRKTVPAGEKKYVYYVCSAHKQDKSCSPHRMRDVALEEIVLDSVKQHISEVIDMSELLTITDTAPLRTAQAQKVQRQLDKKHEEYEKLQKLLMSLYENLADGIGAWAPYGYRKDPDDKHHLVINEETAPTVRQIFKWRSEGVSVVQISRRLNDAGILSPSAYLYATGEVKTEKYKEVPWHTQILKSILAHPVYIGHMVQGRKKQSFYEGKRQTYVDEANWIIVRNTHEPIIDGETFEKVQQIAKQRKSEYHERLGKFAHLEHSENILQGLVWCPNCNRPMVRYKNVSHGSKLWYTYICPGHADDPARCPFVSIREDELNEVLFTAIQSQIQLVADLEDVVKQLNAEPEFRRQRSDAAAKLEAARRTLKRSQSLYDSLYQNYVEQLMTEQEYVTLKARYKAEAEEAERLIAVLEQEQHESKVYTAENRFLTEFRSFMGTDTLIKEMASALIERIYVDAEKNIDIRLRYRDEYMALLNFIEGRTAV